MVVKGIGPVEVIGGGRFRVPVGVTLHGDVGIAGHIVTDSRVDADSIEVIDVGDGRGAGPGSDVEFTPPVESGSNQPG